MWPMWCLVGERRPWAVQQGTSLGDYGIYGFHSYMRCKPIFLLTFYFIFQLLQCTPKDVKVTWHHKRFWILRDCLGQQINGKWINHSFKWELSLHSFDLKFVFLSCSFDQTLTVLVINTWALDWHETLLIMINYAHWSRRYTNWN